MEITQKEKQAVTLENLSEQKANEKKGILKKDRSLKSEKHVEFGETTILSEEVKHPISKNGGDIPLPPPPPPLPTKSYDSFAKEVKKSILQQETQTEQSLTDQYYEKKISSTKTSGEKRNSNFEDELRKAVQKRKTEREAKGLVDKISEKPMPAPTLNSEGIKSESQGTIEKREIDGKAKGLLSKNSEKPMPTPPLDKRGIAASNFESELKNAVQKRQKQREAKGLVDKVSEKPILISPLGLGGRTVAFEEELKQAVVKRLQEKEKRSLKDLRSKAEVKSQQQNQSDQRQNQKNREEKEK